MQPLRRFIRRVAMEGAIPCAALVEQAEQVFVFRLAFGFGIADVFAQVQIKYRFQAVHTVVVAAEAFFSQSSAVRMSGAAKYTFTKAPPQSAGKGSLGVRPTSTSTQNNCRA